MAIECFFGLHHDLGIAFAPDVVSACGATIGSALANGFLLRFGGGPLAKAENHLTHLAVRL